MAPMPSNFNECDECSDPTDITCDVCGDDLCASCMDDHLEEYHGTGGDEL